MTVLKPAFLCDLNDRLENSHHLCKHYAPTNIFKFDPTLEQWLRSDGGIVDPEIVYAAMLGNAVEAMRKAGLLFLLGVAWQNLEAWTFAREEPHADEAHSLLTLLVSAVEDYDNHVPISR